MIRSTLFALFLGYSFAAPAFAADDAVAAAARAAAGKADGGVRHSVAGADPGWLFLISELKHVGTGAFWEKDWAEVSVSGADPVPVLLDLHAKLEALGVQFIYVPVPPKAAIYADKLTGQPGTTEPVAPFLQRLSDGGITVIDLEPVLRAARETDDPPSYCMTDSHPSPATCERIAKLVADQVRGADWVTAAAAEHGSGIERGEVTDLEVKGDLIPDAARATWPAETLPTRRALVDGKPVEPVEDSPVIVLGDSHALIFHEGGEMLMTGAGVVDHLQAELGFPVTLKASRGSSSQALRQIYKPADFWEGRKLLVWVSSAREFTRERRWLKLPRLPK